jgi:hypothetical protein
MEIYQATSICSRKGVTVYPHYNPIKKLHYIVQNNNGTLTTYEKGIRAKEINNAMTLTYVSIAKQLMKDEEL